MPSYRCILGIMVSDQAISPAGRTDAPLIMPEDAFCRGLCRLGRTLGLLVYLFDGSSHISGGAITGFSLRANDWSAGSFPLPDVVYDRTLSRNAEQYKRRNRKLAELKELHPFTPLSGGLPGKWDVYAAMQTDEELTKSLPATYRYDGPEQLHALMHHYPKGLFIKPSAGMHGKGALRIRSDLKGYELDGRNAANQPISRRFAEPQDASDFIARFIRSTVYIIQPYLELSDEEGRAFDVRALIQKDDRGVWVYTGSALREGQQGSVTANLCGGGKAVNAEESLVDRFGLAAASKLLARIRRICERAAPQLEQHFGRLAELGFDFGIEQSGKLWLLEVNAKPGRLSMNTDKKLAQIALRRPLQYAILLASRRKPMFHSESQPIQRHNTAKAAQRIQRRYVQEVHP
ncbi:YheC/YheD family protein [Paenibacillus solisilvae]|uniref:YheC/YheD family protein n=1 Tax=Paenibacillus solisilvae TaxID=2486751 RepID=A0ABW0VPE0_9BACL